MKAGVFILGLILLADSSGAAESSDTEKPSDSKWGLGVGLAVGTFPHYPGSDQNETLVAPFPYLEYYGEKFQLDTDGAVANVFNSDRFNLDFSLSASLPVSDQDNRVREGMDDLELVLEIGPSLEVTLAKWEDAEFRIDLPVRVAYEFTLDQSPRDAGFTFDPRLHYERKIEHWELDFDLGALFASERYHSLYYEVEPEFVTLNRTAFRAESGLTGWRFSSSAKRRWGDWIGLAYLRYMNFSGVANENSPLLVDKNNISAGVALIWMFKTSSEAQ